MEGRKSVMRVILRTQEAAQPVSLVMQAMTLTLVAFNYLAWRGFNTYTGIALLFMIIVSAIVAWGYVYVEILGLVRARRSGAATMDPAQVYAFTPWQEMTFRNNNITGMRNNRAIAAHLGLDTTEIDAAIARAENWMELGYIPKEDFPEHLLKHYSPKQGSRL